MEYQYQVKRKTGLMFLAYFAVVIFTVAIVQGILEVRKGSEIQFFCPWSDTFILPWKNTKQTASLFETLSEKHVALRENIARLSAGQAQNDELWTQTTDAAEEALATITEINKIVTNVNRYRTVNPKSLEKRSIDSLAAAYQTFFNKMQDRAEPLEIAHQYDFLLSLIQTVRGVFPSASIKNYPQVVGKTSLLYTILNREYLKKFEDDLKNTSVFANTLRPVIQVVWYACFRTLGDKAVEGNNSWLFYKPDVDYLVRPYILDRRARIVDPEDKPIRDNAIDSIVAFRDDLASYDIELLVVVVPGKPSIYPEKMSRFMSAKKAGTFSHSLRIIKTLRERGVDAIDLFEVLAKERANGNDAADPLYLRQDTHWRGRGVRTVAQAVAGYIKAMPIYSDLTQRVEYILDTMIVDRVGDVGIMTKIPDYKFRSLHFSFGSEKTPCYQVYKVARDSTGSIVEREIFKDDFQRSKVIILGDSFSRIYQTDEPGSAGWISNLAYELQMPVCSVVSDGGASTLVREKLARKKGVLNGKKLLIWEFVERDLRYGAEGWKDINL